MHSGVFMTVIFFVLLDTCTFIDKKVERNLKNLSKLRQNLYDNKNSEKMY